MFLEKLRLDDRVAVVAGGGRGSGLACCEASGKAGARTVIAEIDMDVVGEGRSCLKRYGVTAEAASLDVTDSQAITQLANALVDLDGRVGVSVACTGIVRTGTPDGGVINEHWRNVNDVKDDGVLWCNRALGRHMLHARRGAIGGVGYFRASDAVSLMTGSVVTADGGFTCW